ncbi:membrane protein [Thermococcus eurythermalis]|uniref:Membrane protein n=1 Tax=Thermococcus eurythermalis TaxID=1505907 RepID=A0A097QUD2_9EURY|nr:BatD family protein [Thermococcus eurythermalis]AIU70064.1 membrane protein [Thermococcus eurythermalis]
MKKLAALILVGLFLFVAPNVPAVSAEEVLYAKISSVNLGLGDKAVLGPYTFTFADVSPDFTTARISVSAGRESSPLILEEGKTVYYPSEQNPTFALSVVIWNIKNKPVVYLDIMSPLKLIDTVTLQEGKYYTLPSNFPRIKVKLTRSTNDYATFDVYFPYSSIPTTVRVSKGSGKGVNYKLSSEYYYQNYLYIKVTDSDSSSATFEVWLPKVASTDFKIIKSSQSGGSSGATAQNETLLVYNGLMYAGERLPLKVDDTTYYVKLISVVSTKASVEVYKGSAKVGTYFVNVGEVKPIPDTPLKVSIQKTEPQYSRATMLVYAPDGTQVTPILRPADIVAEIDAMPKEIMLGDSLVVVVSVENQGKGDAYDVAVAAPVPDNFELVSLTKSWTFKTFPAFTKMPALIYVLKPTKVGEFDIGKVTVTFYDDKSLETGQKKTVYSKSLTGIKVYNIPSIKVAAQAYNGTVWGEYVTAKAGEAVSVKFTLRASEGNPDYEFVRNATLILDMPDSISGEAVVPVGTVKAGETKTLQVKLNVLKESLSNVRATLVYLDPLGGKHRIELGNLVTINSIPPRVITKEVKVWPAPEELPTYVNKTLSELDDPTPLAEELANITAGYLPPESNPWKPLAIVFLLAAAVLGGVAYKYWDEAEKLREKLEKKKQRRPGGLPKKDEEEEKEEEQL